MKLGIVGHAQEKFTLETESYARLAIAIKIKEHDPDLIISGESPMGGVDKYAREVAEELNIPFKAYPPEVKRWDGGDKIGFKQRNLQIAYNSDKVLVVVVKELPDKFKGMKFDYCYHCIKHKDKPPHHIKSGGCWTAWKCKDREWVII